MKTRNLASLALFSVILSACSSYGDHAATGTPARVANGVLTGGNGMTLYTFDRDVSGNNKSVCNDMCAKNWPPLLVGIEGEARGAYSIVTRDDGSRQWAYKGKPLYFWSKDAKPGDKTGDGFNNVWRAARP